MDRIRFRIINKTAKSVTIKVNGEPLTASWDEFNKKFIIVDKFWAIVNDDEFKKQEEADNLLSDICISYLLQRGNAEPSRKIAALASMRSNFNKLKELLECDDAELIKLIQYRLGLLNKYMYNPIWDKVPEYDDNKNEDESIITVSESKNTLGDAFPELNELKNKLKNT